MKAITFFAYGGPEVLRYEEIPTPAPKPDEVLVKVRASSVNAADWRIMRADPFLVRFMFGLTKPKVNVLGLDVAGIVEAVGADVRSLKPGDEVMGEVLHSGPGAFAEYVCAKESDLVAKPANLTFEQAAALPLAGVTALQALKLGGELAGKRVLVNGASSGVGSFLVPIAKAMGAHVTAVCNGAKADGVRGLGPDRLVDYTKEDVTRSGERFDLIVDCAAYRSIFDYEPVMADAGVYALIGGNRFFQAGSLGRLKSLVGSKKFLLVSAAPSRDDLLSLLALVEAGKVKPLVDRTFPLAETADAIRYVERRHATGKVVITV